MLRTGIPVSVWEQEGDTVIMSALSLLAGPTEAEPTDDQIRERWGV